MKFSILIVTLNAGTELKRTVESVLAQKDVDFELIIKDGKSTDLSLREIPNDCRVFLYTKKDSGIYDAMNQAIQYATGDYCIFMNTGDTFYDENVLNNISCYIRNSMNQENTIYYGNCYTQNRDAILNYPDKFNDYICFTMVLCHQATIYSTKQLKKRSFNTQYKIAADYEYYVYAYTHGTKMIHMPITVVRYKGEGASETQNNRIRALKESKEIRKNNFSKKQYKKTWLKMQLHGVGIKHWLVQQEWFYPMYKKIAYTYYRVKNARSNEHVGENQESIIK